MARPFEKLRGRPEKVDGRLRRPRALAGVPCPHGVPIPPIPAILRPIMMQPQYLPVPRRPLSAILSMGNLTAASILQMQHHSLDKTSSLDNDEVPSKDLTPGAADRAGVVHGGPGGIIEGTHRNPGRLPSRVLQEGRWAMFEQIFDEYRNAVDSSLKIQQEMYREWMNGWPVKPPDVAAGGSRVGEGTDLFLPGGMEPDPRRGDGQAPQGAHQQYKSGILAIGSAFETTEAKTSEEYWRLTQEFWRKSIDSYKTAFEAQSHYVQDLAQMWLDMTTKGKV